VTGRPKLPSALDLTYGQYSGWACVWCRKRLTSGAVSAGVARGQEGAHNFDVEVFACPDCANGHTPEPVRRGGDQ